MKILRKAKILPVSCKRCGCLFQPRLRHLKFSSYEKVKDELICPTCKTPNKANFELERSENGKDKEKAD